MPATVEGAMRERIVSTVLERAAVVVGSCLARDSERVRREERVPVCVEEVGQSGPWSSLNLGLVAG